MTVYIEYVLIDNLVIDFLLLKATYATLGVMPKRGRLFACAVFGAMIALLYPLILSKVISTAIKVLTGFLMTIIAFRYSSKRQYFTATAIFFLYTFLTGGAIIGVFSIFGIDYSSEYSIALMFIPVYFLLRIIIEVIKFIYRRKDVVSFTYKTSITLLGKTIDCKGFLDTGNGLYDGDSPVVMCGKRFFLQLMGDNFYKVKLKKITVK